MTLMIQITLAAALILSILVPFGAFFLGEKTRNVINVLLPATVSSSLEAF